jgi:hypothetical protein
MNLNFDFPLRVGWVTCNTAFYCARVAFTPWLTPPHPPPPSLFPTRFYNCYFLLLISFIITHSLRSFPFTHPQHILLLVISILNSWTHLSYTTIYPFPCTHLSYIGMVNHFFGLISAAHLSQLLLERFAWTCTRILSGLIWQRSLGGGYTHFLQV